MDKPYFFGFIHEIAIVEVGDSRGDTKVALKIAVHGHTTERDPHWKPEHGWLYIECGKIKVELYIDEMESLDLKVGQMVSLDPIAPMESELVEYLWPGFKQD